MRSSLNPLPGRGESPLIMTAGDKCLRQIMKSIPLHDVFDRTGLALNGKLNYGRTSSIISMLWNVGAIDHVGTAYYNRAEVYSNPDFVGQKANYGRSTNPIIRAKSYKKGKHWKTVLKEWGALITAHTNTATATAPKHRRRFPSAQAQFRGMEYPASPKKPHKP